MTVYIDGEVKHDHTYYGNGCKQSEYPQGEDGSITPCSTRITQDGDGQNQKNGTYFNFQAANSGSGGSITTDNMISPDTFCPLGWQLPYSGTGGDYYDKSKSWNYLYTTYNIAFNDGTASDVTKVRSYPISYIYSGLFAWSTGRLYGLDKTGDYWSSNSGIDYLGYDLFIMTHLIHTAHTNGKARGFTVRCVKLPTCSSSTARWKELI